MIKILRNPKTEKYQLLKDKIFSKEFAWNYTYDTNAGVIPHHHGFVDMPFYSHGVISRPHKNVPLSLPVSPEWKLSVEVFQEVLEYNNINCKTIYRMNINSSFYVHDFLSPIHIDHHWPHDNLIIYFNSFTGGKTHVFHKKWPYPEQELTPNSLKFSHKGEEDDIITFDGFHYHCMECPAPGERRVVMVATYLK